MALAVIAGFFSFFAGFVFLYQRKIMYFPQRYEPVELRGLPAGAEQIPYSTSSGKQVAFYVPPRRDPAAPPGSLWVCFNGNAARALDWLELIDKIKDDTVGFLLIDYPGYGLSEGKPTRAAIRESSEAAYAALAKRLGVEKSRLDENVNVLGLSIGTATGLDFAVAHPVRRVILLAPFVSAMAMARRMVGWPLCYLLLDRYDNRARLGELSRRPDPPAVDIYHGDADDIVPFAMGRVLAHEFQSMTTFHRVRGADHNMLLMAVESDVARAIEQQPGKVERKSKD